MIVVVVITWSALIQTLGLVTYGSPFYSCDDFTIDDYFSVECPLSSIPLMVSTLFSCEASPGEPF